MADFIGQYANILIVLLSLYFGFKGMGLWGSIISGLFAATFIFMIAEALDSMVSSKAFWFLLCSLFLGALVFEAVSRNKRRENLEKIRLKLQDFKGLTRKEALKGFRLKEELGWVTTSGFYSVEDVENSLKIKSLELGANGLIKFHYTHERESYIKGRGPKGNPHYGTRTVFGGEAVAVRVEEVLSGQSKNSRTAKPTFEKILPDFIVLDGNNIVGSSDWEFGPLRDFLRKLRLANIGFLIFFDNNIYRALVERDLLVPSKDIAESIVQVLSIKDNEVTVSPKGEQADPYIVDFAARRSGHVVSNDNFEDFFDAYPWLKNCNRVLHFRVVDGEVLVPILEI